MTKPRLSPAAAAVVALAATLVLTLGIDHSVKAPAQATTATAPVRALPDFASLVERHAAAVVNISTSQRAQTGLPEPGDPYYDLFRRFGQPQGEAPQRQGIGSGFIISPDGYILTNAHVVADTTEVMVRLTDKRELKARVIGADRRTDVALIKIEARGLPAVTIGDPARLRVGEWVAAIGSPFGFESTVTAGIVSAKSRSLPDDGYVPFIQTDVAINPGNSGGPLFDLNGQVVGINSQIYSRSGGYQGLSFAIPIDVAMKVKDDLQKYGRVDRGRLGVSIQTVSKDLADSFGLSRATGALVNSLDAGGPAEKGGLKQGDVILDVNGRSVEQSGDLPRMIGETRPGETISLKIWRNGRAQEIKIAVGATAPDRVARTR